VISRQSAGHIPLRLVATVTSAIAASATITIATSAAATVSAAAAAATATVTAVSTAAPAAVTTAAAATIAAAASTTTVATTTAAATVATTAAATSAGTIFLRTGFVDHELTPLEFRTVQSFDHRFGALSYFNEGEPPRLTGHPVHHHIHRRTRCVLFNSSPEIVVCRLERQIAHIQFRAHAQNAPLRLRTRPDTIVPLD
jgi:hypothetical protein